jgi:catechol 2,3-dioxygenase-like lactoylglutathione lyase family enzyme
MTPSPDAIAAMASSIRKSAPMFLVRDMRATVRWYSSMGFTVSDEHEEDGDLVFARVTFGKGEFTLSPGAEGGPRDVSLWFFTDRVEELYRLFKSPEAAVPFEEDLYAPFYGGRQFSVADPNGLILVFWQPEWL